MNELQITLMCILAVLGIAFFVVLFARFNENVKPHLTPSRKKLKYVVNVLELDVSSEEHWNRIWPTYYKNGIINYTKIEAILVYIINNDAYCSVRDHAINLIRERVSISVFGDNEITEAIELFKKEVTLCGNQGIKDAGNALIKKVRFFCKKNIDSKKYDLIIQWIFNAIEIVSFILAIITL